MGRGKKKRGAWGWASGDPRRGHSPAEIDYEDPKQVSEELKRIDGHRRVTRDRIQTNEKEINDLRKIVAEAPARIEKLSAAVTEDVKRLEAYDEKFIRTQQLKGGARIADAMKRLAKRKKDLEREIAQDRIRGSVRQKPAKGDVVTAPKAGGGSSPIMSGPTSSDDVYWPKQANDADGKMRV